MLQLLLQAYSRQRLSDAAGTASFIVWLFAQSPQLYENYARASVDGLSPIFLAQWMAGDVTNLVGCLLTQQLPFQIAVATYFCLVDSAICAQYIYYTRFRPSISRTHSLPRHSRYASSITALSAADLRSLPTSPHSTRGSLPASFLPALERTTSGSSSIASSRTGRRGTQSPSASTALLRRSGSWRLERGEAAAGPARGYAAISAAGHSVAEYAALRRAAVEEHARALEAAVASAGGSARIRRTTGSGSTRRRAPHFEPANLSPTRERSGSAENRETQQGAPGTAEPSPAPTTMSDSFLSETSAESSDEPRRFGYGFASASDASLPSGALGSSGILSASEMDASLTSSSAAPASNAAPASGLGSGSGESSPSRGRGMARTAERIEAARSYDAEAGSSAFTVRALPPALQAQQAPAQAQADAAAPSYFHPAHPSHAPSASPQVGRAALPPQEQDAGDEEPEAEIPRRRGGKKRAGAALVGLGTVLGLGGSGGSGALFARPSSAGEAGVTWSGVRHPALVWNVTLLSAWDEDALRGPGVLLQRQHPQQHQRQQQQLTYVASPSSLFSTSSTTSEPRPPHRAPTTTERRMRLIGRLFAWACCFFYMTSRLPQILSNHVRRSVEGLSILLFIAAALGNTLYTLSVLVNPRSSGVHREAYLRESLPFLLGSGGTLVFDAVIVAQWVAWRKKDALPLEAQDEEDLVSLLEDSLSHPPHAPPPGAWSARPSFSRRSSVASALEDVERRARSVSRPRSAVDTLRRSTSAFGTMGARRTRTQSHDVASAQREVMQHEEGASGRGKKRPRPKSATLEGARTSRWGRHTPLERIDTQEAT